MGNLIKGMSLSAIVAAIIVALICTLLPAISFAAPPKPFRPNPAWQLPAVPSTSAGSAILMDWQSGRVLYERNAYVPRAPASTTKVLTAILALEKGRLDDKVTVSRRAALTPGSSMYVGQGQVYSLHDLLHGLLLRSGNDAATAIAEHISGSVEAFAQLMTAKAREIGALNSQFANPHGLSDSRHYSTAYDLAIITRYALENETFRTIVALRETTLSYEELGRDVILHNTNRLLRMLPGADGVKTGTTAAAGQCLIASATRDDHKLVAVVLHAGNRWNDASRLLEWGFQNFRLAQVGRAGEVVLEAPVRGGKATTVPLALSGNLATIIPRQSSALPQPKLEVQERVQAPVRKGQAMGRASISEEGRLLGEVLLVATEDVPKANLLDYLYRFMMPLLRWGSEFGLF